MEITLENRKCHIFQLGSKASPVVFWGISSKNDETTAVCEYIEAAGVSCTIFAFETDDWNSDFSPWEMTLGDAHFQGSGYETLSWLKNTAMPYAEKNKLGNGVYIIAGYSLSGLFALWAFYKTGCACCSGSLWFEGWEDYAKGKNAPKGSIVYLSLGGKESNSTNPVMASIGDKYKSQADLLKKDENISGFVFEMNPGGHFANPPKRIAKGIIWVIKKLQG